MKKFKIDDLVIRKDGESNPQYVNVEPFTIYERVGTFFPKIFPRKVMIISSYMGEYSTKRPGLYYQVDCDDYQVLKSAKLTKEK